MSANITIEGNLGRDPESRHTKTGKEMVTMNVAVKTGWGEYEKTTWWRCTVFGPKANYCMKALRKGDVVVVEGAAYMDEWTNKDGEKRQTPSIDAREVSGPFMRRPRGEDAQESGGYSGGYGGQQRQSKPQDAQVDDSDVPF